MAEAGINNSYPAGDPRQIMRWARRYAKSRTISFLVQWLFIVAMVMTIGLASTFTSMAYEQGNTVLLTFSVAMMGLAIGILTWFSVSPWGSEIIWRVTNWFYGSEGYASYSGDRASRAMPLWMTTLGGGLVIYHLVLAIFVSFHWLRPDNMQPASALYMSPFLAIMIRYQDLGFWAWIWPVLYGVHAVLVVMGYPLLLHGNLQLLNMIGPVFGYGLVAILVGHGFSRFALWKLKSLARKGLPPETDSQGEGDGD